MKKFYIVGIAVAVGATSFLVFRGSKQKNAQSEQPTATRADTAASALEPQTNSEGMVTVTVTPINLSETVWSFDVALNTHSEELNADLVKTSFLVDENGKEYAPIGWEGAPPGGHHREGTLKFDRLVPRPRSIKLKISQIGGISERIFMWITFP